MPDGNAKSYNFDIHSTVYRWKQAYSFETESGIEYLVDIIKDDRNVYTINFAVDLDSWDDMEGFDEQSVILNRGEFYRVMATIIKCVEDFIQHNDLIEYFSFTGNETYGKHHAGSQREEIYVNYIRRLRPNWEITHQQQGYLVKIVR
ncbi:MAG: hypothetical protein KKA07_02475 [Bacteroidetes bacterium]|nr:hypothetical protein [Bacteroidota bacterium]MBU1717915.1 hypothetical protein [Bacteroidota bacterium]